MRPSGEADWRLLTPRAPLRRSSVSSARAGADGPRAGIEGWDEQRCDLMPALPGARAG